METVSREFYNSGTNSVFRVLQLQDETALEVVVRFHSFIPFTACRGHAESLTSSSLFKHPPAATTGGTKFVHSTLDTFLQHAREVDYSADRIRIRLELG